MRKLSVLAFVLAALTVAVTKVVVVAQAGDITVTASYKGKGPVDEKHNIWVFLFDHPKPTPQSEPLGTQSITKNDGTATFKGVSTNPVYVTLIYNEKADYNAQGPPPAGAPIGSYTKGGKPVPVKPGDKVKATFDDSARWK
jgi:hypothetical protein